MNQTITIDGEVYEVDQTIAGEIETLRNTIVSLAVFIGGDPCWCRYAKTGEHTEACRATKLKLWPRPSGSKATSRDYLPWK